MSCLLTSLCLHGQWTNTEFLCSQYTYGCMNRSCLSLLNYCQDNIYPDFFLNNNCVDGCRCSCPLPNSAPFVAFNAVMLLAVVLPVIAVNTAILVALALESSIVKVIRLVLASILISCLLSALGLAMYHIAEIVLSYSFPVNGPPSQPCTNTLFLLFFGGGARLVFMATISTVVYIIVKHGNATKKRLVVGVLVAVVVLWVITFLGTSPLFSQQVVRTNYWLADTQFYCSPSTRSSDQSAYIFWGMYLFFFCVVTSSVAVIFLLIICCNRRSFTSATAVEKTLVKFGFFLFLGSGLNMIGLFVPLVIAITGDHYVTGADPSNYNDDYNERYRTLIYAALTLVNAGVIPTPILLLIFFKSIRKRLLRWLCCCKRNHNNNNNDNNGEGRMVTATV